MKLKSVRIHGVRGIQSATYELGDVAVVTGPNGAGKSTVLGSVLFALTGRFPGLPAMSQGGASLMARNGGKPRFMVALSAETASGEEILITRAWQDGKGSLALHDGRTNMTGKQAEGKIVSLFGDVAFMSEALDPEGSIWGLSREKRKAWASALCRSASGWTTQRLVQEVGSASSDWDPSAMDDPGASLDLNISRLQEAVRTAQAVARQAESVANTMSGDDLKLPSKEEVQKKQAAFEAALTHVNELTAQQGEAARRRAVVERDQRSRRDIEQVAARCREAIAQAQIPPEPQDKRAELRAACDEAEQNVLQVEMDLADARARLARVSEQAAVDNAASVALGLKTATSKCPTCGHEGDFSHAREQAKARTEESQRQVAEASQQVKERTAAYGAATSELARAEKAYVDHRVELSEQRQKIEAAKIAQQSRIDSLQRMEDQLSVLPVPDPLPADDATLDAAVADAKAKLATARTDVDRARSMLTLAREREAQREASVGARDEAERLKELLRTVIEARDKMLRESIEPLRVALKLMKATAPDGGVWDAEVDGDALDIGLRRDDGSLVPAETLSSGERYRLTAALLVARAKLRREPWVGIVFDGFEQVCPEDARLRTLSSLAAMVQAGDVDNAIFAAATDQPVALPGATAIHLGK